MTGNGSAAAAIDHVITATIRALAAGRGVALGDVAAAVDMPRSTFERRLAKGCWSAAEVARIAEWFSVPISDLFTGLEGHLGHVATAHALLPDSV